MAILCSKVYNSIALSAPLYFDIKRNEKNYFDYLDMFILPGNICYILISIPIAILSPINDVHNPRHVTLPQVFGKKERN